MTDLIQSSFLQAVGWAVLNSLWQVAFLWILYKGILYFLPSRTSLKGKFSLILIIGSFLWFVITLILFISRDATLPAYMTKLVNEFNTIEMNRVFNLLFPAAAVVYLILLTVPLYGFIRNYRFVRVIRQHGLIKMDLSWKLFVTKTAGLMGIKRNVSIWISDQIISPVTIGFLKPLILIPAAVVNQLSVQQIEAVILHELSHIRRHDYIINIVINFIRVILYFNPFIRSMIKDIEQERESSCDEMVIRFSYSPYDYASALLQIQKSAENQFYLMMSATGKNYHLLERIEAIFGITKKNAFSFKKAFSRFITILFAAFGFLFLTLKTQDQQTKPYLLKNGFNPYYFLVVQTNNPQPGKYVPFETVRENTDQYPVSLAPAPPEALLAENFYEPEIPEIHFAGFQLPTSVSLPPQEEERLKETIEVTKRVLKEKEWKELEKSYAEAFTSYEKAKLHELYNQKVNEIDWQQLEQKLRSSYEFMDWSKINSQLQISLAQIRQDSLHSELNNSVNGLTELENWMKANSVSSVPDSDMTLKSVEQLRKKAIQALENLKARKEKKIVKI